MARRRVIMYVDGFNLYKRRLQGTPYKWLNLRLLAEHLFHDAEVSGVKYFTARVRHQPHDPHVADRQLVYLRALGTEPLVEIHEGVFRMDLVRMPVHPLRIDEHGQPVSVRVRRSQEKGSDVNLASHLLLDAWSDRADLFAVVSNDSDLATPLRMVREDLGKRTALVSTAPRVSRHLLGTTPSLIRQLRDGVLEASQFPTVLRDARGTFRMPEVWRKAEAPAEPGPRAQ
jgi:uncharacterized LabA/DUF88 family protein